MVNRAAAALGRKGGKATGASKVRGDAEHYRDMAVKSAAVRRAKAEAGTGAAKAQAAPGESEK